jgi:hypothetical protein
MVLHQISIHFRWYFHSPISHWLIILKAVLIVYPPIRIVDSYFTPTLASPTFPILVQEVVSIRQKSVLFRH